MGKNIICGSCGASFEDDMAKCPYCGSTNVKGAELEYMGKLEDVRKDIGELGNAPLKELQAAVKKQGRFLKRSLIAILVIAAIATLAVLVLHREKKKDYIEEYLWKQEHFPQMSQLYDNGEYDAMMKLAVDTLPGDMAAVLGEWEHYNFYEAYACAKLYESLIMLRDEGYLSGSNYGVLFRAEWDLVCLEEFRRTEYTEKEWEVLEPYIEQAKDALTSEWGMTDREYREFLRLAEEDYFHCVPYANCEEFINQWLKEQE